MDHNPYLKLRLHPNPDRGSGKGSIERPGRVENMRWQTRSSAPTEYEDRLGDALERVFESGAHSLAEVVAGLNGEGFLTADGGAWTEAGFQEEMRRLASR